MNNLGSVTLITERLILRKFSIDDALSAFVNWSNDKEVQKFVFEPVCDSEYKTERMINQYIENYKKDDFYRWAIILKETGECIGNLGFFLVKPLFELAEIEYLIGNQFQNKGYMTEAVAELLRFGFMDLDLFRIQISHMEGNNKSKRVIEKLGFKYEGTLRKYFKLENCRFDRLYYSILKNEYC